MTEFEKALLRELKGIRKELGKLNEINDEKRVKIPPPEELIAQQIQQIIESQSTKVEVDGKQVAENITYDPLGVPLSKRYAFLISTFKVVNELRNIKNFLWATFNYRNKGILLYRWPKVGFTFMKLSR